MTRRPPRNNVAYRARLGRMCEDIGYGVNPSHWLRQTVRCIYCGQEHAAVCEIRNAVALDCPHCKSARCSVAVPMRMPNEPEGEAPATTS